MASCARKGAIYSRSIDELCLRGVLPKIVSSISINAVNAGHTLGYLPVELGTFCVHLADPVTFAKTIFADVLLLSDRFREDILLSPDTF